MVLLPEAEDIKKRWQEYTEELYKKDLQDQDNHDGVITHLEPDILEYEVKWALGSITTNKASRDDDTRLPYLPPEKPVCSLRSNSCTSRLYIVYCHPACLTYMQSTSYEMPGWMKHKLESRLLGEISATSDMQMTPPLWQKAKRN